ncbi:MAG: heme NO-binding domain-containing protein [Alteromonadaceae bacterium]
MQGSIFTSFSEMVIEEMGMPLWNQLLDKVNPPSKGIYTNGMQYDDSEIMVFIAELSILTQVDTPTLLRNFGEYLFIDLFNNNRASLSYLDNLKDFLKGIDHVVHKEVRRLYPDAYVPTFKVSETPNGDLIMLYQSKRKLCHLSEGLITGAAKHFDESISIHHPECMHDGAAQCKLVISFEA